MRDPYQGFSSVLSVIPCEILLLTSFLNICNDVITMVSILINQFDDKFPYIILSLCAGCFLFHKKSE